MDKTPQAESLRHKCPSNSALTHRIAIRLNTCHTRLAMLSQVNGFCIADKEKP
jgi:hypothetical protein